MHPNWTGCYIGGNVGYGRARNEYGIDPAGPALAIPDQTLNGIVGGGQIGCDYQFDPFVVGIQGTFDWTSMDGTGDPFLFSKSNPGTVKAQVPWIATLTGRVGYAFQPSLLVYVKGGAAWARTELNMFTNSGLFANADVTRTGWTVGGGLEWMFAPNWSVFVEYNHLDFDNRSLTFTSVGGATFPIKFGQNIDLVQLGVNYRFNWWH